MSSLPLIIRHLQQDRGASNGLYVFFLGFLPLAAGAGATLWLYYGVLVYLYFLLHDGTTFNRPPVSALAIGATLFFFAVEIVTILIAPNSCDGLWLLPNSLQFLLFPFLLRGLWLSPAADTLGLFIRGARVSALFALTIALIQYFAFGNLRPDGLTGNALPFGGMALLCSGLSLLLIDFTSPRAIAMALAGHVAAVLIILMSGARGALLALPVLYPIVIVYAMKVYGLRLGKIAAIAAVLLAIIALMLTNSAFRGRLQPIKDSLRISVEVVAMKLQQLRQRVPTSATPQSTSILRNDKAKSFTDSETERLSMWYYGLEAASEKPIFGHGPQNRQEAAIRIGASEGVTVPRHSHLHNEYITTLAGKGIVGLVSLLLLLATPLLLAWRSPRDARFGSRLAFAALLSASYAIMGLTNLAFGHDVFNTAYIGALLALSAACAQAHAGIEPDVRPHFWS